MVHIGICLTLSRPRGSPSTSKIRLALDRVKSISALSAHSAVKGLTNEMVQCLFWGSVVFLLVCFQSKDFYLLFFHFKFFTPIVISLARGGDSHMKQKGMLVVSLRGANFVFWSRLGCPGQSANILSW